MRLRHNIESVVVTIPIILRGALQQCPHFCVLHHYHSRLAIPWLQIQSAVYNTAKSGVKNYCITPSTSHAASETLQAALIADWCRVTMSSLVTLTVSMGSLHLPHQ